MTATAFQSDGHALAAGGPAALLARVADRYAETGRPRLQHPWSVPFLGGPAAAVSNGSFLLLWRGAFAFPTPTGVDAEPWAHVLALVERGAPCRRVPAQLTTLTRLREAAGLPRQRGVPCPVCRDLRRFCPSCGAHPDLRRDAADAVWVDPLWMLGVPMNRAVLRACLLPLDSPQPDAIALRPLRAPAAHGVLLETDAWSAVALGMRTIARDDFEGAPRFTGADPHPAGVA